MTPDNLGSFQSRHIGPDETARDEMLRTIGVPSLDALIDQTIPSGIRSKAPLDLPEADSEYAYLRRLRTIAAKNTVARSYIGLGYYDCVTPSVILRNVFENPGWYTPYTPYQAEIAQGRLESLLNFQTVVKDLTGMDIANASLLDEGTAAAEAMTMFHRLQAKKAPAGQESVFLVSERCFPQTIDVVRGRALPLDIRVQAGDAATMPMDKAFGILLQYPGERGEVMDLRPIIEKAHAAGLMVAVASDLLALTLLTPPGEMGADVVLGNSQRFGVPLGYGGPHAAFFATRESYVRQAPGRIIGISIDAHGDRAYRMALQTREQHIRREKATSNICTAQALLANIAAMYAVFHGPRGLRAIGERVHSLTRSLEAALLAVGCRQTNAAYFDTLRIEGADVPAVRRAAETAGINFRYDGAAIGISLDEATTIEDVADIVKVFAGVNGKDVKPVFKADAPAALARTSAYLTHPVFNSYQSETKMMRYIRSLERKDVGLDTSMIALGSCTMKLNAASEMLPVSWPEFSKLHPFAPPSQAVGYAQIFAELEEALRQVTGLAAVSLQPNSGAQGEFTGLMTIRAYHRDRGDRARNVVLIPSSAHGTNPASATMAGLRVVVVACDSEGNVELSDLRAKAAEHRDRLAALMVTYPSTHGVFEEAIKEICTIVHEHGGQVYMDGANMNAQVGLTSPAAIGADVCHLNLHKTFAIPHGGGGPGMGPIAVAAHLAPYLPGHAVVKTGGVKSIPAVAAAPWGSASILLISYGYIRMLGARGLTDATRYAILNANYIKARLKGHYGVLYANRNGRVAHEMIFDLRPFKHGTNPVDELDVAKRLMDYGFHAPTVSFPVAATMMVEPTESEPKDELDRFCDALIAIRKEIQAIADGTVDPKDNLLKNAPHTASEVTSDTWSHPYSREQAAYPLPWVRANKVWPAVARIDNPYGDRNLICACPPIEAYAETL
ncbi:MAG: glycine dehydrogenase (aminomethyl-transferring) [Acidobacteria bacterium RIFCSPLOWO2_02_FULL_67_36]|nr:MAG: glycine dehydrogenase (aminomethyl-transferring) [Acidobacteria bacterium RIFCSPLOWO2_02_FULL_67_36]OFW19621.1 MAG: glycine dehydrogenase (aminomethyl-transferring) [Acidobacteria bacterium RIFCSPLOWO2_12_FULL_66_21]